MELKFRFKEKEPSLKYLSIISRTLQYTTDMKDVLRLEYIIPTVNFGPIIKSIIDNFLSPLRMKIYMIAEKYKNLTNELVPFYRYRYREEMASAKTCANWWNNPCAVLNLPACNEFLPTMINVKPCEDNVIIRCQIFVILIIKYWYNMKFSHLRKICGYRNIVMSMCRNICINMKVSK